MAIELVEKYLPYVDEQFTTESKKEILTNQDFSFSGGHTVESLEATTQSMTLTKDRSFTFAIDALDEDETGDTLEAASALARQIREVVIPEVDTYTMNAMCKLAGIKPNAVTLTKENIYTEIITGNNAMDNA